MVKYMESVHESVTLKHSVVKLYRALMLESGLIVEVTGADLGIL